MSYIHSISDHVICDHGSDFPNIRQHEAKWRLTLKCKLMFSFWKRETTSIAHAAFDGFYLFSQNKCPTAQTKKQHCQLHKLLFLFLRVQNVLSMKKYTTDTEIVFNRERRFHFWLSTIKLYFLKYFKLSLFIFNVYIQRIKITKKFLSSKKALMK